MGCPCRGIASIEVFAHRTVDYMLVRPRRKWVLQIFTFFRLCLHPIHPCLDFVCDLLDLTPFGLDVGRELGEDDC